MGTNCAAVHPVLLCRFLCIPMFSSVQCPRAGRVLFLLCSCLRSRKEVVAEHSDILSFPLRIICNSCQSNFIIHLFKPRVVIHKSSGISWAQPCSEQQIQSILEVLRRRSSYSSCKTCVYHPLSSTCLLCVLQAYRLHRTRSSSRPFSLQRYQTRRKGRQKLVG